MIKNQFTTLYPLYLNLFITIIRISFNDAEPVAPFFNMNETTMNEAVNIIRNIDMDKDSREKITLKCIAGGLPKPSITWYKVHVVPLRSFSFDEIAFYTFLSLFQGDDLLKKDDNYNFSNNYQELSINEISESVSGMYSCRATNRVAENKMFQKIIVQKKCK